MPVDKDSIRVGDTVSVIGVVTQVRPSGVYLRGDGCEQSSFVDFSNIEEVLPRPPEPPKVGETWRHNKTNREYQFIHIDGDCLYFKTRPSDVYSWSPGGTRMKPEDFLLDYTKVG